MAPADGTPWAWRRRPSVTGLLLVDSIVAGQGKVFGDALRDLILPDLLYPLLSPQTRR